LSGRIVGGRVRGRGAELVCEGDVLIVKNLP
jgi:hypothetical protein